VGIKKSRSYGCQVYSRGGAASEALNNSKLLLIPNLSWVNGH
jgi:hypothetical protein